MPNPQRTYIAFDLEIYKDVPGDFSQWRKHRPLRITCAATSTPDGKVRTWCGASFDDKPGIWLKRHEAIALVEHLEEQVKQGYTLLTWNGLSFDFNILAEESGLTERCRLLAMDHVDMMFHIFCEKGFPLGLDKAAKGMGLPGKPDGMTGAMAPFLWKKGKYQQVMDYVCQDALTTLQIARHVEQKKQLEWLSTSGKWQVLGLPRGWMTVREAFKLPEPDTSWMSKPIPRREFIDW